MSSKREIVIAGEKVWLCAITGSVAGEKKWSESRTSGGSYGASGHTVVRTTVNTRHEFWLVAPDGEERCVELGDSSVSVREHQVLTAVWGAKDGKPAGSYLLLRNHNAQSESWLIKNESALLKRMGLSDPMLRWTIVGVIAGMFAALIIHGTAALFLGTLIAVGGIIYGFTQRRAKVRTVKEAAVEVVKLELGHQQARAAVLEGRDPMLPA